MPFLKVNDLSVSYAKLEVVFAASFEVGQNEIVTLLGANGAGKSTILKAICGVQNIARGEIYFLERVINPLSSRERVNEGIILVPEGKLLFQNLSVLGNLKIGAMSRRSKPNFRPSLMRVYELFPRLQEREKQLAGTLSGGEQQMLAIGRGLMSYPKLLMLDEPSLGLAPMLVRELFKSIRAIKEQGTTILLVEQNVHRALETSDSGYVLENGRISLAGPAKELLLNKELRRAYLGL